MYHQYGVVCPHVFIFIVVVVVYFIISCCFVSCIFTLIKTNLHI